jgi:hypothetical protein
VVEVSVGKKSYSISILSAVLVALTLLTACDDGPTEPVAHKEYAIYFNDGNYNQFYYRYLPLSGKIDTFETTYGSTNGFIVSADGRRLYLVDNADYTIAVLSTDSAHVITNFSYGYGVLGAVSPDNKLVAFGGSAGIHVLSTDDYHEVYADTIPASPQAFSSDSRTLYCLGAGATSVYRLHLGTSIVTTSTRFANRSITQIAPSVDERLWFLYCRYGSFTSSFAVYDLQRDSIIFEAAMIPGSGALTVDPLGRYVFITDPGTLLLGPNAPPGFYIYDIGKNDTLPLVNTSAITGSWTIRTTAVTPDGRLLVAGGYDEQSSLMKYELHRPRYIGSDALGSNIIIWTSTCQSGL